MFTPLPRSPLALWFRKLVFCTSASMRCYLLRNTYMQLEPSVRRKSYYALRNHLNRVIPSPLLLLGEDRAFNCCCRAKWASFKCMYQVYGHTIRRDAESGKSCLKATAGEQLHLTLRRLDGLFEKTFNWNWTDWNREIARCWMVETRETQPGL